MMRFGSGRDSESDRARDRLLLDQLRRPLVEQQVRLKLLSARLERTVRDTLIGMVSARVRQDPRYAPVLQKLVRLRTD